MTNPDANAIFSDDELNILMVQKIPLLTYFNTIVNFVDLLNQEEIEITRNERLDRMERKLDFIIEQLEKISRNS